MWSSFSPSTTEPRFLFCSVVSLDPKMALHRGCENPSAPTKKKNNNAAKVGRACFPLFSIFLFLFLFSWKTKRSKTQDPRPLQCMQGPRSARSSAALTTSATGGIAVAEAA